MKSVALSPTAIGLVRSLFELTASPSESGPLAGRGKHFSTSNTKEALVDIQDLMRRPLRRVPCDRGKRPIAELAAQLGIVGK